MMTKREFKAALALLGWNVQKAAEKLTRSRRSISSYMNGKTRVPPFIHRIIELELNKPENFRDNRKPIESVIFLLRH